MQLALPLDVLRIESCPPPAAKESPATAPAPQTEDAAPAEKTGAAASSATGVAATSNAREMHGRRV